MKLRKSSVVGMIIFIALIVPGWYLIFTYEGWREWVGAVIMLPGYIIIALWVGALVEDGVRQHRA